LSEKGNVMANPMVVLREELDDWAVIFDPSNGEGFAINPVSLYIWKRLDGKHTTKDILAELSKDCNNLPEDAESSIDEFIQEVVKRGLAGYEI
jgi:SynChlorMet cassette protein ScmD